jgi:AraC-like DNA-binding protein
MRGQNHLGAVKVRNIRAVQEVLREVGLDIEDLLDKIGLERDLFSNRDNFMGYPSVGRLVAECVKATGWEDFGLRVGMRQSAGAIGLAGFAAINAPTVRQALETFVGSLSLSDSGGLAKLEVKDGIAVVSWSVAAPGVESSDQVSDRMLAFVCNFMRTICGQNWNAIEVCVTRSRPRDARLFSTFFRAPIRFDADEAALIFPSHQLDLDVAGRDADLHGVLAPLLERAIAETRRSFGADVLSVMRSQISSGPLTPTRTASAFGMSARSFMRRLAEEATSFQELAQQTKFETAQALLSRDKGIAEIAVILGYSDPTAFARAFKVWSGKTPTSWRPEQRRERPHDKSSPRGVEPPGG